MIKNNTRYAGMVFDDVVNGEGLGAVFFAQYCPHRCKQCHNPSTWNKEGGKEFTIDIVDSLMQYYDTVPFANRLTISGGEPLSEFSIGIVQYIVNKFKEKHPDKKIWLYTGHTFDYVLRLISDNIELVDNELSDVIEVVKQCDVIVDGRYVCELKDVSLPWQGSSNQRVISVQESIKEGRIILYDN